jgi:hypothetical protein
VFYREIYSKQKETTMMSRVQTVFATVVALVYALGTETAAFVPSSNSATTPSTTSLSAEQPCSRREAMFGVATAALLGVSTASTILGPTQPAEAKYSDYSRREKDWNERQMTGEIKYSSARDLRKQLAEIVPANNEGSKVFCPNGPSAAVSPLMENKCSDVRMAMPSVYGRQQDVVGNSIPGFTTGYAWGPGEGSASLSAGIGGMPSYKENEWKLRDK